MAALTTEDEGDLAEARTMWVELVEKYARDANQDRALWGLHAQKKLNDLSAADRHTAALMKKLEDFRLDDKDAVFDDDLERRVVTANRLESFKDYNLAHARWLQIAETLKEEQERRAVYVLARGRVHDLAGKKGEPKDAAARATLINAEITKAKADLQTKNTVTRRGAGTCSATSAICTALKPGILPSLLLKRNHFWPTTRPDGPSSHIQLSMQRAKSHAAFERAKRVIPGGVNSPARAFGAVGGEPLFIARAEGAYLYDIDGNRYVDYIGSWGPMILGHAHPRVVAAAIEAARNGSSFGAPTERETELAELDSGSHAGRRDGAYGLVRHGSIDERRAAWLAGSPAAT